MHSHTEKLNAVNADIPADLYAQLEQCARRELSRHQGQTLDTVGLVHESYLRLGEHAHWHSRSHFVGTMVKVMRSVLVDGVRKRMAAKRGAGAQLLTMGAAFAAGESGHVTDVLALDQAMHKLKNLDERLEQVAELRFFGGLDVKEVAQLLQVSEATVKRDARTARAFLATELLGHG